MNEIQFNSRNRRFVWKELWEKHKEEIQSFENPLKRTTFEDKVEDELKRRWRSR